MAGFAWGALKGLDRAAGADEAANDVAGVQNRVFQQKDQERQLQLAPLSLALKADHDRLALYADPNDPSKAVAGHENEYNETLNRMADTIGKMRAAYGQKAPGEDPNPLASTGAHLLDKLHITRDLASRLATRQSDKVNGYYRQNNEMAGEYAQGVPYSALTPEEQAQAARVKAGIAPKDATEQERFTSDYLKRNPGKSMEDALRAYTDATTKKTEKPPAEPKPLESGGVLYGVSDPSTGKQYLQSQMDAPDTPQNIKEIWKTVQAAQAAKKAEADAKEAERDKRFLESQANIAARMGQTEQWQAKMADYREALGTFKTLDANAHKTQTLADTYAAQYADPNTPKAAVDTALLTDFTSVLAQGGRKTQAEIALARNIGDLSTNIETAVYKRFHGGELPPKLRKMYLDYIDLAAKTQREDADKIKPAPPEVSVPQGPKTKALKDKAKSNADPLGIL